MKINELRIGNIIGAITVNNPVKVTDIFTGYNDDPMVNCDNFSERGIEDFEPIPLTEDWLINLGFSFIQLSSDKSYKKYAKPYMCGAIRINYKKDNSFWYVANGNTFLIKSVHQLQNLYFALTNTELMF